MEVHYGSEWRMAHKAVHTQDKLSGGLTQNESPFVSSLGRAFFSVPDI